MGASSKKLYSGMGGHDGPPETGTLPLRSENRVVVRYVNGGTEQSEGPP